MTAARYGALLPVALILCARVQALGMPQWELAEARRAGIPWVLLHRPQDEAAFAAQVDPVLVRLRLERQILSMPLSLEASAALRDARGWGTGCRWILCAYDGTEAATEEGVPTGGAILDLLRARGAGARLGGPGRLPAGHPGSG